MMDVLCVGHASFDVAMSADHHPAADEKMQASQMHLAGGGPAANASVQVARLGGRAAFCGYLGNDIFGEAHAAELVDEGVDVSLLRKGAAPTPVSQILAKPDGSRSVVNYKGDTPELAADVPMDIRVSVILFDGHEPALSEAALQQAGNMGATTILDAGSLHAGTRLLCRQVDVLAASSRFAAQFTGLDDMTAALECMAGMAPSVVITLGARGLLWACGDRRGEMPAFAVDVVDSTGAGDAFHGALALALARNMPWIEALRYASAAGALACTRLGARAALATADELQALLESAG